MVTYNQFDGRMIECIGTDPSKYDAANWNYVFLVNFIDRFMANTIETFPAKRLFEKTLNESKRTMLEAKKSNRYMCNYIAYKKEIEQAYDDIKE